MKRKNTGLNIVLHIIIILILVLTIVPILLTFIVSFTDQSEIVNYGYQFLPKKFSLDAYRYIFGRSNDILNAYKVTIFSTVVGTVVSVLMIALYAYPISMRHLKFRKFFTFFIFFTMLFNGGMVAWYMVVTQVLHMKNTIWALIFPLSMNAWYVIIMRTFFQTTIHPALIEAAKIDGAGEFRIFIKIVMPLAVPGIATIALFQTLAYWNDWWNPMLLINQKQLYNLQFYLQVMMNNIQMMSEGNFQQREMLAQNVPAETARMALCVVAMGPILIVYPFFQKYFIQGLTIGSVKG